MAARLVLASASPRRLSLLRQIGLEPCRVVASGASEAALPRELPAATAARLALAKARKAAETNANAFVLAADTVVACGRRRLEKPADAARARAFLEALSGRRHRVHTGLAVLAPGGPCRHRLVTTIVQFKRLDEAEVLAYLESGEWRDAAGGYAVQGRAAAFVRRINGSYSNIVGLPLYETVSLLAGLGFPVLGAPAEGDARRPAAETAAPGGG